MRRKKRGGGIKRVCLLIEEYEYETWLFCEGKEENEGKEKDKREEKREKKKGWI